MTPRRVVGIIVTAAARKRYFDRASVERLKLAADVRWLELEGPDRVPGPPPESPGLIARVSGFVADLDVLIVSHGSPRITDAILAMAPKLTMIGDTHGDRFAARVDVRAAADRGIVVVDTTNASSYPVAEWALALTLMGLRNLGSLTRRIASGELVWPDPAFVSDAGYRGELTGKTVGIVALGVIGRRLLELLAPFDVDVLAYDPHAPDVLADAYDIDLTSLDTVFRRSDVVISLVPLTSATERMMGRAEFDAMKPGSVFVNVSRGAVVDTDALVSRLEKGDIVACLDVTNPEPPPVGSALRTLPNVILTPHIAGVTAEAEPRFFDLMVDEIERVLAGHRPRFPLVPREPSA